MGILPDQVEDLRLDCAEVVIVLSRDRAQEEPCSVVTVLKRNRAQDFLDPGSRRLAPTMPDERLFHAYNDGPG
jgi:hypothetical protein